MNVIHHVLPELHVGHSQGTLGPLTLFPIWTDAPLAQNRRYRLPESGHVGLVNEHEDGPRVQELVLDNPGADPLLVLEGMTLDGGWQHRVLTMSILAAPRQRTQIPVRCIEQSRWQGERLQRFSTFDAPLRMRATLRTLDEDIPGRAGEPDQGRVWDRVAAYERSAGVSTPTHSLHDMQRAASGTLENELPGVRPLPGQRGVIVAVSGHPVLAEITDHPETLADRWDALLSGLALDVAGVPLVPTPAYRARSFARKIVEAEVATRPGAGIGLSLDADDHDLVSLRGIADDTGLLHALVLNTRHDFVVAA